MYRCACYSCEHSSAQIMHLSMLSRWGGEAGQRRGFDSNHRPVVGFFDRFKGLSSNILLTFSCYFGNPQCPGVGHLNGNSQLSSNAPPTPGLPPPPPLPPPQRLNIDRCINYTPQQLFVKVDKFIVKVNYCNYVCYVVKD